MDHQNVWLIGPLGIDLILRVQEFPNENNGCMCNSISAGIGWDAAIVAQCLNAHHYKKYLLGNHIGFSEEAQKARLKLKASSKEFIEIGNPPELPQLNIVISSQKGTRTWISTVTPPGFNELKIEINRLKELAHPNIIYSDHLQNLESPVDYWMLLNSVSADFILYNWGDYSNYEEIPSLLNNIQNVLIQISLEKNEDLSKFQSLNFSPSQFIIITRDENSVVLLGRDVFLDFRVTPLYEIDTTGAGGYFSSSIINNLSPMIQSSKWNKQISKVVDLAISDTHKFLEVNHTDLYSFRLTS